MEEKVVLRVRVRDEEDNVTVSGTGDPEILLHPVQAYEEAPEWDGGEVAPGVQKWVACGYFVVSCELYSACLRIWERSSREIEFDITYEGHLSEFNEDNDHRIYCDGAHYSLPFVSYHIPKEEKPTVLEAITYMLIDEERALERALLRVLYAYAEIAKGDRD